MAQVNTEGGGVRPKPGFLDHLTYFANTGSWGSPGAVDYYIGEFYAPGEDQSSVNNSYPGNAGETSSPGGWTPGGFSPYDNTAMGTILAWLGLGILALLIIRR